MRRAHECDRPHPRTVMDRVVSSHTPTVRALDHARRRRRAPDPRALVVCVPHAPGTPELREVEREAGRVRARFGEALTLTGSQAVRAAVLRGLGDASHVHFACHGVTDREDPSRSRLLVHDHEETPLTVSDIFRLRLEHAELAYLSACDTARTPKVPDEPVHITGAMQIAGYPHVIGTLWNVDDAIAADIASDFYAELAVPGTEPAGTEPAGSGAGLPPAAALHAAVRRVRDRYPGAPTLWAAHIHAGA
nr:CHAT domain-containing protein [Sphaerisporangium perillae]